MEQLRTPAVPTHPGVPSPHPHTRTPCAHTTRALDPPGSAQHRGPRSSEGQEWCSDNQYQQRQGLQILYHSCKWEMMKSNPSLPFVQAAGEACPFLSVS